MTLAPSHSPCPGTCLHAVRGPTLRSSHPERRHWQSVSAPISFSGFTGTVPKSHALWPAPPPFPSDIDCSCRPLFQKMISVGRRGAPAVMCRSHSTTPPRDRSRRVSELSARLIAYRRHFRRPLLPARRPALSVFNGVARTVHAASSSMISAATWLVEGGWSLTITTSTCLRQSGLHADITNVRPAARRIEPVPT